MLHKSLDDKHEKDVNNLKHEAIENREIHSQFTVDSRSKRSRLSTIAEIRPTVYTTQSFDTGGQMCTSFQTLLLESSETLKFV